ncbi:MAG: HD-GYP domain-containing protein [Brevinematales bacterium]|jgi:HD-GYP domain-containing protein (c-di-GMP phosphodiesterase class II)
MLEKEKLEIVDVNFLREGVLLCGIVYDETGNMLWPARKTITAGFISRLKDRGIKNIFYSAPRFKDAFNKPPIISEETKIFALDTIEEIGHQVRYGKLKDLNAARRTVERFLGEIKSHPENFLNLMVLKDYDSYTFYHSINVGLLSVFLTKKLGFNDIFALDVGLGGFLHDIGKILVPSKIVNKNGTLTAEEFKEMKKHPIYGYNLIREDTTLSNYIKKTIIYHHEKWDGNGYPIGLKDEAIGNFAGIVSVCDVYDALTTERPYKQAYCVNDALIYIMRNTMKHFNPYVSQRFVNELSKMFELGSYYPVGSYVYLNTGEVGYIINKDDEYTMRPGIIILKNFQGFPLRNPIESDLKQDSSRIIYKTIDDPEEIERLSSLLRF